MRFNIPASLLPYFQAELQRHFANLKQNNLPKAWLHLERAHIVGQAYPVQHTYVHWLMLRFGWRTKNLSEVSGQMIRIVLGFLGSLIGKIPVGNTGGANVPMNQPMPIPADLQKILAEHQ